MSALTAARKSIRRTLGIKGSATSAPRNAEWYNLSPARRIIAATLGISVAVDSRNADRIKPVDALTESKNITLESLGLRNSSAEVSESGAVSYVRSRLDILFEILTSAADPNSGVPFMGGIYLNAARRYIWRLREGLAEQRLEKSEALRIVGLIEHNLREAEKLHRRQSGLPLDEVTRNYIGDLVELGNDITGQGTELRQLIIRLFDEAEESTRLIPSQ
ncbi:hypothetical protein ACFC09_44335 [Streptomyces sp. NPDC056161]|uniref:hypothetical protein n=1 Tax=Streptomyces sp. NPDC056161 TaxID=3345732 RepID=UPI0035DE3DB3